MSTNFGFEPLDQLCDLCPWLTVVTNFDAPSPRNAREYPDIPYFLELESQAYTFCCW